MPKIRHYRVLHSEVLNTKGGTGVANTQRSKGSFRTSESDDQSSSFLPIPIRCSNPH